MQVVRGIEKFDSAFNKFLSQKVAIAIGNFDGVHLGHQKIFETLKQKAGGSPCFVYTFRPHPQIALRPEKKTELLTTYEEKLLLLEKSGIDLVIEEPFSREFSSISPDQFFIKNLIQKLNAHTIVVGYDFAFGKERQGQLDLLQKLCHQYKVHLEVVPPFKVGELIASSSKIREALQKADLYLAEKLLGRPFRYKGIVVRGDGRGSQIGVPTANFKQTSKSGEKLTLPFGVYVTESSWSFADDSGAKQFHAPSITNVGVRPTFHSAAQIANETHAEPYFLIETHLIDTPLPNPNLYGVELSVDFKKFLRPEKKFSDATQLKAQISKDLQDAKDYHNA